MLEQLIGRVEQLIGRLEELTIGLGQFVDRFEQLTRMLAVFWRKDDIPKLSAYVTEQLAAILNPILVNPRNPKQFNSVYED